MTRPEVQIVLSEVLTTRILPFLPRYGCDGNATADAVETLGRCGWETRRRSREQLGSMGGELRRAPGQQTRRTDQRWDGRVLPRWVSCI